MIGFARHLLTVIVLALVLQMGAAHGQITSLADDIILITKGVQKQEQDQTDSVLGGDIGGRGSALGYSPGSGGQRNEARFVTPSSSGPVGRGYRPLGTDVLQAAAGEPSPHRPEAIRAPQTERLPAPIPQFLGALEVPEEEDEGPTNGLTLDNAIALLVRQNYDLRSKWFEIPQSRADVLTASLRANPLLFGNVGGIPYQAYSAARPGNLNYSGTIIYPVDISHKRRARTEVASQAHAVIEAQYQDAVRRTIDRLYAAFVEVVAARESSRYSKASRDGLAEVVKLARQLFDSHQISRPDFDRIAMQLDSAEIGVEQTDVAYLASKHALGLLLGIGIDKSEQIELQGTMRDYWLLPARFAPIWPPID
jgi:cobalt-zinc-cadmium efflux system outer membrane protein